MSAFATAVCKYCPEQVIWTWTGEARLPVDPDPCEEGNVVLSPRRFGAPHALVVSGPAAYPGPRYRPHFDRCPGADEARRPRSKKPQQSETLF